MYRIFLDDIRHPSSVDWHKNNGHPIVVTRNFYQFTGAVIWLRRSIDEISFDHDLGREGDKTGYDAVTWLEEQIHLGNVNVPRKMSVHSANPSGAARIKAAIDSIYSRVGNS